MVFCWNGHFHLAPSRLISGLSSEVHFFLNCDNTFYVGQGPVSIESHAHIRHICRLTRPIVLSVIVKKCFVNDMYLVFYHHCMEILKKSFQNNIGMILDFNLNVNTNLQTKYLSKSCEINFTHKNNCKRNT